MNVREELRKLVEAHEAYGEALANARKRGGDIVRQARDELGLSQRDLAKKLNVNHTYLSKIENGRMEAGVPLLTDLYRLMMKSK